MIEFEISGPGPFGGPLVAPFFVCATCGERVTRGDANALFVGDGQGGRSGEFVVVHRGVCDPHRGEWQRLPALLIQLLHNSGYDLEDVCHKARTMAENGRRWEEGQRRWEEEAR